MGECETSEATSNSSVGIVLVLLACVCYAVGNCLQRYSLLRKEDEKVFYVLNKHVGWLLGAIIYFSANGIYAVALSFAPVSVLAAVFSLTIVANATCARLVLGDSISPMAYPGYAAVLAGSIVFSLTVQAEVCHFDGAELKNVMTSPSALIYWIFMGFIIFGGIAYAFQFEKKYPLVMEESGTRDDKDEDKEVTQQEEDKTNNTDEEQATNQQPNDKVAITSASREYGEDPLATSPAPAPAPAPALSSVESFNGDESGDLLMKDDTKESAAVPSPVSLLIAGFIYPASLGATEAVGALILKAVNSLFTTLATDDNEDTATATEENDAHLDLWIGLLGVGIFVFGGIIAWLRLVYSRFEITAAFPVEFGMLTFASVVGGFMVFEDHQYVGSAWAWVWVVCASMLILGGIGIVGIASWRHKVNQAVQ